MHSYEFLTTIKYKLQDNKKNFGLIIGCLTVASNIFFIIEAFLKSQFSLSIILLHLIHCGLGVACIRGVRNVRKLKFI